MSANAPADLQRIYEARFDSRRAYRRRVWSILIGDFFQQFIAPGDTVLDLGCGYGEFINTVRCARKLAMDLNPDAPKFLDHNVQFLEQDCSTRWSMPDGSLNAVFTSNFFEHLPDKAALGRTLDEIKRCLAPGGRIIALGPNIKHLPGAYWDFWDHYLPLTETSLQEAMATRGFEIERCLGRFLPYTMASGPHYPPVFIKLYLKVPLAWRWFGKQFLVVGRKP
jgi:SAM-dependent methyltransferase